jgi:hypothetical protein
MEPFHMPLIVNCPDCGIHLVRVAQSSLQDFAICPGCLAAGTYDDVMDDPARLTAGYALPKAVQDFVRNLGRQ